MPTDASYIPPFQQWETFNFPANDLDSAGAIGRILPAPMQGYCSDCPDHIGVAWVSTSSPYAFIAFLNELDRQKRTIIFYTVINPRLARLLKLRGYQYSEAVELSQTFGETVVGWVKGHER